MTDVVLVPGEHRDGDRRTRRRRATLEEILETSLDVMAEEGVGALSLSEVARRMGVKPPSLYKHVDSKHAVYDLLFAAGSRAHDETVQSVIAGREPSVETLWAGFEASVRWCVEHPVLTQLMYWRPVPGYEPSPEAFAPSLRSIESLREMLERGVEAGVLQEGAKGEAAMAMVTCLISGVVTQQLANEPGASFARGRFSRHTREAFELFAARYAAEEAR